MSKHILSICHPMFIDRNLRTFRLLLEGNGFPKNIANRILFFNLWPPPISAQRPSTLLRLLHHKFIYIIYFRVRATFTVKFQVFCSSFHQRTYPKINENCNYRFFHKYCQKTEKLVGKLFTLLKVEVKKNCLIESRNCNLKYVGQRSRKLKDEIVSHTTDISDISLLKTLVLLENTQLNLVIGLILMLFHFFVSEIFYSQRHFVFSCCTK